jgi:hypothetical protein
MKHLNQYRRAYHSTTMLVPMSYRGTMKQMGLFCEKKQYDLQNVDLHITSARPVENSNRKTLQFSLVAMLSLHNPSTDHHPHIIVLETIIK